MPPPEEPFSNLVEAAVHMHEIFRTYVLAGFTEDQAIKLIGYILTNPLPPEPKDDPRGP